MSQLLRNRAGFTLAETMIALVLTAVIGAAVTGVFVTQARFFDIQEKAGFARGVTRGAVNIIMSELRMLEQTGAFVAGSPPTTSSITVRVPYLMGLSCTNGSAVVISALPADPSVITAAATGYSGFAYRNPDGTYTYLEGGSAPTAGVTTACETTAGVNVLDDGGSVQVLTPAATTNPPVVGAPVMLYQIIQYEFKTTPQGTIGLYREKVETGEEELLVAPFAPTAQFRFFVADAAAAVTTVPADLSTITGIELILDSRSERPNTDGTYSTVPLTTSVFFKNRL